jgi:hypothetical protein
MSVHRRIAKNRMMEGGSTSALVAPVEEAMEMANPTALRQSHMKVNSNIFPLDPNLDFDCSQIDVSDRFYNSDSITQDAPLSWQIQPSFNVFRNLALSRFIFRVQLNLLYAPSSANFNNIRIALKPFFSYLFIQNETYNINNVNCADQAPRTSCWANWIKCLLIQSNLQPADVNVGQLYTAGTPAPGLVPCVISGVLSSICAEDSRTYTEGIVHIDGVTGIDSYTAAHTHLMFAKNGFFNQIGMGINGNQFFTAVDPTTFFGYTSYNASFEIVYRPMSGVFLNPHYLPPGVNLNFILTVAPFTQWLNGYSCAGASDTPQARFQALIQQSSTAGSGQPKASNYVSSITILSAVFVAREVTVTQTALKSYQQLILRSPCYFNCVTSNTLLYDVNSTQIQLTNLFSGRLGNIVTVCLLSGVPSSGTGNLQPLLTHSPLPGITESAGVTGAASNICLNQVTLIVNGRRYSSLWSSPMTMGSSSGIAQWYEQYKLAALVSKQANRGNSDSNSSIELQYKMDNPLLSLSEFQSVATVCCINIRRNGTIFQSGDREVGSVEMLVTLDANGSGAIPAGTKLLVQSLNTDSILSISDGGASSSFIF